MSNAEKNGQGEKECKSYILLQTSFTNGPKYTSDPSKVCL